MRSNPLPWSSIFECRPPGLCILKRPRNDVVVQVEGFPVACQEEFDSVVVGAGVRDKADVLGAAVLTGPRCKTHRYVDWDAKTSPFSISSFLMNDGVSEFLQFDAMHNSGLVVGFAQDLVGASEPDSKLPLKYLTLETSFIPSTSQVFLAGLMGVAQQGVACAKGWSLTYSSNGGVISGNTHAEQPSSTLRFSISLEANVHAYAEPNAHTQSKHGPGAFVTVSYEVEGGLPLDSWTHVVATYDGARLRLFFNGRLVQDEAACSARTCGEIVYPTTHSLGDECMPQTLLTLGTYTNARLDENFGHSGVMSHARILNVATNASECAGTKFTCFAGTKVLILTLHANTQRCSARGAQATCA
jgi:hypothetical protein